MFADLFGEVLVSVGQRPQCRCARGVCYRAHARQFCNERLIGHVTEPLPEWFRSGDQQGLDLNLRGRARFDGAASGNEQIADCLDWAVGGLRDWVPRLGQRGLRCGVRVVGNCRSPS